MTAINMDRIAEIMTELRSMGCAVTVMTPEDVGGDAEDMTPALKEAWLYQNRRYVEDAMVSAGNRYIDDNM